MILFQRSEDGRFLPSSGIRSIKEMPCSPTPCLLFAVSICKPPLLLMPTLKVDEVIFEKQRARSLNLLVPANIFWSGLAWISDNGRPLVSPPKSMCNPSSCKAIVKEVEEHSVNRRAIALYPAPESRSFLPKKDNLPCRKFTAIFFSCLLLSASCPLFATSRNTEPVPGWYTLARCHGRHTPNYPPLTLHR